MLPPSPPSIIPAVLDVKYRCIVKGIVEIVDIAAMATPPSSPGIRHVAVDDDAISDLLDRFVWGQVDKICEAAEKIVSSGYITGSDLMLRRKAVIRITTGSQALDELLGGKPSY